MKVSIITVCFNSEKTIRYTIESVIKQTYKNIEYIIVDGRSTDNTISIINEYEQNISHFISEKDNGIYDAFNKGIGLANGEIIGIINSDDTYYSETIIQTVVDNFIKYNVDSIYGDLVYVKKPNSTEIVRYWKSRQYQKGSFAKGFHPPHPTFFVKRNIYNSLGLYNTKLQIASDFELMLRFLEVNNISTHHIKQPLVKMSIGGESGKNIKNIYIGNRNILISFKENNIKINSIRYYFKRYTFKIYQNIFTSFKK